MSIDPTILKRLRKILADFYPDELGIRRVATDAGIDLSRISFNFKAIDTWYSVFQEAQHVCKVDALLSAAEGDYGANESLCQACAAYRLAADQMDHIDADLCPFISEEKTQPIRRASDNSEIRQTDRQDAGAHVKETTNGEIAHQQHLQIENTLRSHPDFIAILQKGDFVPTEERNGRDLIIVRPKVAIKCRLPLAIDQGWCQIEFSDIFFRGLTIKLEHKDILKHLIIGRGTPVQRQTRKFIRALEDGNFRLSIGPVTAILSQVDVTDLCKCVDKVADAYIGSIMEAENALEAWNRSIESRYLEDGYYGYEILSLSVETWKEMFQATRENSKSSSLGYEFYAPSSSIKIETNVTTHAEIVPKPQIINGLPSEKLSLLYIPPEYEETWQNNIGPKGFWTANFTKNWILEKFLPTLKDCYAKDDLAQIVNPNVFWNINEPHLFEYHLDVIHSWIRTCIKGDKPTSLFVNYCQAFNQLVSKSVIEDKSSMWGYVLEHTARLRNTPRNTSNGSPNEEFLAILIDNLKHLQRVEYISDNSLDYMFRGHYVLLRDFKISSTQSAINNFKNALWPLFERASFESRFCHLG